MKSHLFRFLVLQLIAAALLYGAWVKGWIHAVVLSDPTYLTQGIAAASLFGLLQVARQQWSEARQTANQLAEAGLIGTVIGFFISLGGVDPQTAGDVNAITPMVATLISGMSVALTTTLVGAITGLWIVLNVRLLQRFTDAGA